MPVAAARLVLFGLAIAIGYAATWVALRGWTDSRERPREGAGPMPAWRRRLMWVTRISARCILFSFGYHWIKRKGKPAPRELAPTVVSNHVSYIDPIYFFYELFPTIVSSDSHDSIPFVGTIIRAMQVIYIDRFSPASRKSAVNEIKVLSESGRTRPLAWRQDQLRGLLRFLANKEEEAFRALHDDLGKHRVEAYRDKLGSIGGANEEEPTRRSW